MNPTTTPCPHHAAHAHRAAPLQPPGSWPPGPPAGLTGWGLLRRMSRDILGACAAWRRDHGDLVHLRIWPEHQIVVTAPHLVRELLVTHHDALIRWERGVRVFSQLHGHSVLTAEGGAWKTKRQALQPVFSPKGVQSLIPVITAATDAAFAGWRSDGIVPIERAFNALGMDIILRTMFSSGGEGDAGAIARAVHDMAVAANAAMYWPASWPDWMPWKRRQRRAARLLERLICGHIAARLAQHQAGWPDDLLSRLLALHRDDPATWPLRAVRDDCMTGFMAGHETSAATLTWWSWCMAAHPAAQAAARAEVDAVLQGRAPTAADLPRLTFLHQTLQETLRLYPAAPVLMTRRSTAPLTLDGWQLPAGTLFAIPLPAMQHDARWFDDPLAFKPERFAPGEAAAPRGAFMPFGSGPRVCLGQHLALAEMTVVTAMLLQRCTLNVPEGMAPPAPLFNISLRPATPLLLQLRARASGQ